MIVDVTTSASDGPVFGIVEYSKQKNSYVGGDQLNVAANGNIVHLWTAGAINRGQRVSMTNPSTTANPPTIAADTTNGDYTIGFALGQASAANNFVRVQINPGLNGASTVTISP